MNAPLGGLLKDLFQQPAKRDMDVPHENKSRK